MPLPVPQALDMVLMVATAGTELGTKGACLGGPAWRQAPRNFLISRRLVGSVAP